MEIAQREMLQVCRLFQSLKWGVKKYGLDEWLGLFDSRLQAIEFAVKYSQNNMHIFVHDTNGRVAERLLIAA